MEKAKVFINNEDDKVIQELSNKIYNILNGYTLNQIEKSFVRVKSIIDNSLIIDCSSLMDLQDESL